MWLKNTYLCFSDYTLGSVLDGYFRYAIAI
jgi:hypothetical protein